MARMRLRPIQEFQFVLAVVSGNCSKHIVQLSWLSLCTCINLRKEQIDRSKGQRVYLFVNGRKEYVKFSRINCCKFVWDHTKLAILMNADHKQEKDSQHRTGE